MDVRAIFELPVHIWVMCDALDATYSTGYDELRFSVVMPQNHPHIGGPPPVPGVESGLDQTGELTFGVLSVGSVILTNSDRSVPQSPTAHRPGEP